MSTLAFMPWCRIDKIYDLTEITVLPFVRNEPIPEVDQSVQSDICTLLASYRNINGQPIARGALVHLKRKPRGADFDKDALEIVQDLVALICFAGLANRDYFNPMGPYCNSDCFALYFQRFETGEFTALTTRRREGRTTSGWPVKDLAISIPVHCHVVDSVTVNQYLLAGLERHRESCDPQEWGRWQNAIASFNQANTDNDSVRYQTEWVLLSSAFEHLLDAKPNAKDVAYRFADSLQPAGSLVVKDARRRSERWQDGEGTLRYEWMQEFYRIRGDFAHGRLDTRQPACWKPLEHLVLATIAFPLLVKSLLQNKRNYTFTEEDIAQIDCFEQFADREDFLDPPTDQKSSLDSHWARLVVDHRRRRRIDRTVRDWNATRMSGEEPKEDS